jgi:hypothetical protein
MGIILNNIYYRPNGEVKEYKDIFFDTNIGLLQLYITSFDFVKEIDLSLMFRLIEIDKLKFKYINLFIEEVRKSYDNNIYILLSGRVILAIEYVLNSVFEHSVQEFRFIEDIDGLNEAEFNEFKELDSVELPIKLKGY